jgi:hypothetical protein
MPHTESRYQQDLGFTDGEVFAAAGDLVWSPAANATITRNAAGNWSVNQAASLTVNYAVNITTLLLRREGFFEDIQEQFGGTGIAGSAQPQFYRPDQGILLQAQIQQLLPRTAFKTKGFKLISYDVIYQTSVLALSSITTRVDQTVFVNNVAPAITSVLASGQNGLSLAVPSTGPNVTTVSLPVNQQIYRTLEDMQLWIELTVVTPATSTFALYGFDCDVEFNYN